MTRLRQRISRVIKVEEKYRKNYDCKNIDRMLETMTYEYFNSRLSSTVERKSRVPAILKDARNKIVVDGQVVLRKHFMHKTQPPRMPVVPDKL
jgi:hypothetical protein